MLNDIGSLVIGMIGSVLVAQATQEIGLPSYLTSLSSSGVLAVVFYYVLNRYEKRIDAAFKAHGEMEERMYKLLESRMKSNNDQEQGK